MEVVRSIRDIETDNGSVVTVGTFDGLHLAHRSIINKVVETGRKSGNDTVLVTFEPHPRLVVRQNDDSPVKILTSVEEKIELLRSYDLDKLMIIPFSKEFSQNTPDEFVGDILHKRLSMKTLVVGFDHAFGKNRSGNIDFLKRTGVSLGFDVLVLDPVSDESGKISSTRVRNYIEEGSVSKAAELLGRPYSIRGMVVKGAGRGKELNFPTANVEVENSFKCVPGNGIYVVKVTIDNEEWAGAMSIGVRPTFNENVQVLEVYILDLNRDLYGKQIKIDFFTKLRDELKFDSIEELVNQMESDVRSTREFFDN